ncbi:nuclear transport factor 2 family protein [Microseira sp. BLCC-F43]|jgi:ketosteroid isomerase-like protein|uniref:nuclear transport factor 2 family protein n=1 Tax=Microseira sp. BLCC-F43 TaxID=3153602 RepID=UPI0035B6D47B
MNEDKTAVLEANKAFYRAFERKDIEAMSSVWSQGVATICVHPGWQALKGWKDIRYSWEQIFKNTNYIEVELEIVVAEVRGDIAYVVLVENVFQVINGRRMQAQSLATNIFERMAQKWYLINHHASPVMRS